MTPERYSHILSGIGLEAFIIWYFSTGEPLLHKQLFTLVSTSKHQQIFSAISTNLSLPLSDTRIDELIRSGLGMISVAMDGTTAESYGRYRVGGKFDLVVENIRRLVARKAELGIEFPLIEWRFLRFRHNQHEEEAARSMAAELSVDLLEFFPGSAPPDATDNQVQATNAPLVGPEVSGPGLERKRMAPRGLLDEFLADEPPAYGLPAAKTSERKCDWLYFGTMIYPNGAVGPCCVANDKNDDFSNIDDFATFKDAWNASKFRQARDLFATKKSVGHRV